MATATEYTKSIPLNTVKSGLVRFADAKKVYRVLRTGTVSNDAKKKSPQRPYFADIQDITNGLIGRIRFNSTKTCKRIRMK